MIVQNILTVVSHNLPNPIRQLQFQDFVEALYIEKSLHFIYFRQR